MQLQQIGKSNVVASSGVQTSSSFNIARTPHMFNILSSGLYSDKVTAVLREIGCNAMDAHIMGGTPNLPFEVKLPSALDRTFHVKDWGPGLDDREVTELYTTYGWSSKQESDDVTGAFGLGSKSPFAYTMQSAEHSDGFTVVAVKHGVKRIYVCHIGDDGAPSVSRIHEGEADADWPHGVMVTFPVQEGDIREFHQKANQVFSWFKVPPTLIGLDCGELSPPKFQFNGEIFSLAPKSGGDSVNSPAVVTGNVRYPISVGRLGDVSKASATLLGANVHLRLPIGSVLMTPSREELQYTEKTKSSLREALDAVSREMGERLSADLRNDNLTQWEWFSGLHRYLAGLPALLKFNLDSLLEVAGVPKEERDVIARAAVEAGLPLPRWTGAVGRSPETNYELDSEGNALLDDDRRPRLRADAHNLVRVWVYQRNDRGASRKEVFRGAVPLRNKESQPVLLGGNSNVKVFFSDSAHADARVRCAVRDGMYDLAILVSAQAGSDKGYAEQYAHKLCGPMGIEGLPFCGTSELPIPDTVGAARQRALEMRIDPYAHLRDEEVFYMPLNGGMLTTTMGDLDESDRYYLTSTTPGRERNGTFRNFTQSTKMASHSFAGYRRDEVMNACASIISKLNLDVTGVVVVRSEAAARRLKLKEQGFKSFLPFVQQQIHDNMETLLAKHQAVDRLPRIDFTQSYNADDYGLLGVLGFMMTKNESFAKKFEARQAGTPLLATMKMLLKKTTAKRPEQAVSEIRGVFNTLRRYIGAQMVPEYPAGKPAMDAAQFLKAVEAWSLPIGLYHGYSVLAALQGPRADEVFDLLMQVADNAGIGQGGTHPILDLTLAD